MKKFMTVVSLGAALAALWLYTTSGGPYPPLRTGDLIFQTSTSSQSGTILIATGNPYTHMGIIKNDAGRTVVIEAGGTVKETPLSEWINRGILRRVAIYRDPELTEQQTDRIVAAAETLYGKPYDIFFSFHNDAIYCSELPHLAYRAAGRSMGKIEKVSDLYFDNALVRELIKKRWQRHSECTSRNYDFEQCYTHILNQELVTPASIAADSKIKRIYSNYPF
jgi:hypothetical protein